MNTQDIVKAMQTGLLQQNRLLKLDTPLGEDVLLIADRLAGFAGTTRDWIEIDCDD